jgi:hypothetical protein
VTTRVVLVLAALGLLVGVVLLVVEMRTRPTEAETAPAAAPVAALPAGPPATAPQPALAPPKRPDAAAPAAQAPAAPAGEKLVRGELPYPPPLFADARDRERFKRWWVTEMVRRADVYRRLEPDRRYPSDQEIEHMMDRLYDLSEPPPATGDTTVMMQAADRQAQYFDLANKGFVGAFGVPATEIVRRGGDPKWGTAPDPPVLPPNWQGP